jgi:hypothetical protein
MCAEKYKHNCKMSFLIIFPRRRIYEVKICTVCVFHITTPYFGYRRMEYLSPPS